MEIKIILEILGVVIGYGLIYHKFIIRLIDNKLDKVIHYEYRKDIEERMDDKVNKDLFMSELNSLRQLRENDNKTIFKQLDKIDEKISELIRYLSQNK